MDAYESAEAKVVLGQLESGPLLEQVASSKWKERKEALEAMVPLLDTVRLARGDYSRLTSALEQVVTSDANVFCVELAVRCCGLLARGLRRDWLGARAMLPVLLDKFKEKKQSVSLPPFPSS